MDLSLLARATRIEAKALALQVGLAPPLVATMAVIAAAAQEPGFFRLHDLDLTWPLVFAIADIWGLLCALAVTGHEQRSGITVSVARAAGCLGLWVGGVAVLVATAGAADLALRLTTPWVAAASFGLRSLMVWVPIHLLAHAPMARSSRPLHRFLALTGAYLVQTSIHPASLHTLLTGPSQLAAAVLATVGSTTLLLRSS